MTKFKVGQMVKVVNNSGMVVSLGATAIVTKANYDFMDYSLISVVWKRGHGRQMDGAYMPWHFEPVLRKNEQLLFSFMTPEAC